MPDRSGDEPRRLRRGAGPTPPVSLSPTGRLASMKRERIDALERDKAELKAEVARLLPIASESARENARLEEALQNAGANGIVPTGLIGVGGFLVSYATFTGRLAPRVADAAAGCLLSGIACMLRSSVRRRLGR